MTILFLLVPLALLLGGTALYGFFYAVKSDQYEDLDTPPYKALLDNPPGKDTLDD